MRVAELTGGLLDYWVARAEGFTNAFEAYKASPVSYSSEWNYGGLIIDCERISIKQCAEGGCYAYFDHRDGSAAGSTPLIAAMRAYVASKFGDEVPDEGVPDV